MALVKSGIAPSMSSLDIRRMVSFLELGLTVETKVKTNSRKGTLFLVCVAFDHLNAKLIRPFNEGILDFAVGHGLHLFGDCDTVLAQLLQGFCQIVEAEANMIHNVTLCGFKFDLAFPAIREISLQGFSRVDDDIDIVRHQRNARTEASHLRLRFARSGNAMLRAEMLDVPFASSHRVCTIQMQMAEAVMVRCVQLDQRLVRAFNIGVIELIFSARTEEKLAQVGQRRKKLRAQLL